jgi:hypothetical protein
VRRGYSPGARPVSTYCAEVLSQASDRGARDESGRLPAVVRHDVKVLLISERPTGFYLDLSPDDVRPLNYIRA